MKFRTSKLHLEYFFPPLMLEMRKCQKRHKIWWTAAPKALKSSWPLNMQTRISKILLNKGHGRNIFLLLISVTGKLIIC